ncbi:hypothetical protein A1O1_04521 [Capronia coronata CBS 617.96]|uniref:O-methyltransferase C-terminal domain-containing protein n=1 Tax=Capronia coronata CBS 617.96 TaxID=1182541 RepID=W9ZA75_9EURO|nr:uncharacterized protein A1O1_04521 [Capronia coronata CBS 617.96]EXJ91409.1 hypothetical protein A1O1_04521 [Capronia coronata CBS 617.96]
MGKSTFTILAEKLLEASKLLDAHSESSGLPPATFDNETFIDLPDEIEKHRKAMIDVAQDIKRLAQGPRDLLFETCNTFNDLANLHFIYHFRIPQCVPLQGGVSYEELAVTTGLDTVLLRRMIRHSIINRVLAESSQGHVKHSAASRILHEETGSMDAIGFWLEELFPAAPKMVEALKKYSGSGEPNETAFNLAFNTSRPFYLELETSPERARRFGSAMRWMSQGGRFSHDYLVRGYYWAAFDHTEGLMVDVGGGHGAVSLALARATAQMKFIVQDLPNTVEQGRTLLPSELQGRLSFMEHDFFDLQPVKGADIYFMRYILHNWSDKYAARILENIVPALKDGARIVCCEFLPGDEATTRWTDKQPLNMDMIQAIGWNSIERTASDWKRLFSSVDSRLVFKGAWTPEGCSVSLIEAQFQSQHVATHMGDHDRSPVDQSNI